MRIQYVMTLSVICFFLMSATIFKADPFIDASMDQDLKIVGIYDGQEDDGYHFITTHKDGGSEYIMIFQNVAPAVMREFDLDEELFLNQKFEVTYTVRKVVDIDEDDFEEEVEVYTITHLKAL